MTAKAAHLIHTVSGEYASVYRDTTLMATTALVSLHIDSLQSDLINLIRPFFLQHE